MFDIGFAELLLVSIVGLLVLGPERLPGAIRTSSLWLAKLRRSFNNIRMEIEREINTDDIKREIHNDAVMQSLKAAEEDLKAAMPTHTPYDIGGIGNLDSSVKSETASETAFETTTKTTTKTELAGSSQAPCDTPAEDRESKSVR